MKSTKHNSFPNSLMRIFDIQQSFQKHKQRILSIGKKNPHIQLIKNNRNHINFLNKFKNNRTISQTHKYKLKQQQLQKSNKILFYNLFKQQKRQSKYLKCNKNQYQRRTASQNSTRSLISIQNTEQRKQNQVLLKKILNIESTLTAKKFQYDYNTKTKKFKEKLENYDKKKREILKKTLRKMNIQPSVYFPKVRKQSQKHQNAIIG